VMEESISAFSVLPPFVLLLTEQVDLDTANTNEIKYITEV
jgi:hypothetical protein